MMTAPQNQLQISINNADPANIEIILVGQLDIHSTASIWQQCMDLQSQYQPDSLTVQVKDVGYCDGAGIALLQDLHQKQTKINKRCLIKGLPKDLQDLLDKALTSSAKMKIRAARPHYNLTEKTGLYFIGLITNFRENIIFIGALSYQLLQALLHPGTIRWQDFWRAMEDVGPRAMPIIILIGFLMGLITAFQAAIPLEQFGAQIYIANLVGISLVRELGPLMTAVLLIGRTSSSFAAEIGTMKINQEVDALVTMGLNPVKFLTVPRVMATTLMTPLLNVFLILFGLIGCGIVMYALGFNLDIYLQQLENAIKIKDFVGGLIKAFVFGIMIAGIGCLHGLKTKTGPSAVGYSTTQAVVSGIIMLVIIDGIFAWVYYIIGM